MRNPAHLKILYVGTLPPHRGGSAISCGQIISGVARAGHTVCALASITAETLQGGDRFAAEHPELSITRYVVPFFDNVTYRAPDTDFARVERDQIEAMFPLMVENLRPDLVIAGRESFAPYVPKLARACELPSVLLVRGANLRYITRGDFPEDEVRCVLEGCRAAGLILSVADHITEDCRGLGLQNVKTIPNAIDLRQFCPSPSNEALTRELRIPPGHQVVLVPANLHPRKRPLDVVESAAKALRVNPRLVYVMVGQGMLRSEVEQACKAKDIFDSFRFTGWIDHSRMPDLMNFADVVIVAAEAEGLARVYMEAMACERLLLASDIAPAREVVQDGVNALLFRMGDTDDLAAKTLLAVGDPQLRARIGPKARESMQSRSIERAVDRYVSELEGFVARSR